MKLVTLLMKIRFLLFLLLPSHDLRRITSSDSSYQEIHMVTLLAHTDLFDLHSNWPAVPSTDQTLRQNS